MQDAAVLEKRRDEGQENPVSCLHNNSTFPDLESFLESVLVPSPVSINAELVPSVLSRGLGLASHSESLGQQGSNDRRSGRPRSSVSNGMQGHVLTNNNNIVIKPNTTNTNNHTNNHTNNNNNNNNPTNNNNTNNNPVPTTKFEAIPGMNGKEEDKNNLLAIHTSVHPEKGPGADNGLQVGDRRRQKTRKRDNNSTAGGTSRKKKTKDSDKLGPPPSNAYALPGMGPQPSAQYVFGMPQMGLPSQMPPQQLQQMQQQLQQQLQQQMHLSQMGQMGLFPQAYMYGPHIQLPDGRIAGFYPGMDQFPIPENVDADVDHTVKRSRLVWTSELHKKFLDAVDRCGGIEHALPKAIMNDMKVTGLTRENVSSHLQKYRIRVKETEQAELKEAEGGHSGPGLDAR